MLGFPHFHDRVWWCFLGGQLPLAEFHQILAVAWVKTRGEPWALHGRISGSFLWLSGLSTVVERPAPQLSPPSQMPRFLPEVFDFHLEAWHDCVTLPASSASNIYLKTVGLIIGKYPLTDLALGNKSFYFGCAHKRCILTEAAFSIPLGLRRGWARALAFNVPTLTPYILLPSC